MRVNRAASAPSMTRWSYDSDSGSSSRGTIWPSRTTGCSAARDSQVVPRLLLHLSLSYDHRVIDGADAARFTRRLAEMLENPLVMLLDA